MKSSEFLKENADMGAPDESRVIAQLSALAQPVGINGGGYTYYINFAKNPLQVKASDGSKFRVKSLHELAQWMDNKSEWLAFLDDHEDLQFLLDYDIVRPYKKRNDRYSDQEYHELKGMGLLEEDATAGATASGSVSAVVGQLGGSTKDLIKRQKNYTNQQTAGGIIKGVRAAKVK